LKVTNPSQKGFNPLPAFGPGDTVMNRFVFSDSSVSIRSRLLGREILHIAMMQKPSRLVSIRSRLLGREIRVAAD